jgi:6-phosphogluconolactonase
MRAAIQTSPNRDMQMSRAADRIEEALREGIAKNGHACAALSGGSTPAPAYKLLAARPLDWSKVIFALADERFVPPSHEASNERLLRETLAQALAQGAQIAPLYAPVASAAEAAALADATYAKLHFDIALLGMGEDGHTLSWFPGIDGLAAALDPANPRSVMALHAPNAAGAADRLTLTRSALTRAERIVLLVSGLTKFAVLNAALSGDDLPVAALASPDLPTLDVLWAI